MVEFVLKFIDRRVKQKFCFDMSCKFSSSVVLLLGGSLNFQLHIRTQMSTHLGQGGWGSIENLVIMK